jgi:hypothetical protein
MFKVRKQQNGLGQTVYSASHIRLGIVTKIDA